MKRIWRGNYEQIFRRAAPGPGRRGGGGSGHRRLFSAEAVSHPANRVQVYVSRSVDPHVNLSLEHFLLASSHPDSVVLLLYANRPCVVIGRNQNPWVEANLALLNEPGVLARLRAEEGEGEGEDEDDLLGVGVRGRGGCGCRDDDSVQLVRRRSGGGAVFHDLGNMNYSVICPPADFDRDRHAEMVVRALRSLDPAGGRGGVRVNERHDIVLDVDEEHGRDGEEEEKKTIRRTYKISGSAYKLTRRRSLHHGTCLLASPNLRRLGAFLRSPAAPYIRARGVESVRSDVANFFGGPPMPLPAPLLRGGGGEGGGGAGIGAEAALPPTGPLAVAARFEEAVIAEFAAMYGPPDRQETLLQPTPEDLRRRRRRQPLGSEEEGKEGKEEEEEAALLLRDVPEIARGVAELRSPEWLWGQTPQFDFSTTPAPQVHDHDNKQQPQQQQQQQCRPETATMPAPPPAGFSTALTVRQGRITRVDGLGLPMTLQSTRLCDVDDWRDVAGPAAGEWLNGLFGVGGKRDGTRRSAARD
ncbi:hypothetical protein GGR56DRAFT_679833 [Xylariaceae sp. FL0804]|nr:hypothetical protein GGR56DRAFT_679833 [Xylariaceae sp. FL0804]